MSGSEYETSRIHGEASASGTASRSTDASHADANPWEGTASAMRREAAAVLASIRHAEDEEEEAETCAAMDLESE